MTSTITFYLINISKIVRLAVIIFKMGNLISFHSFQIQSSFCLDKHIWAHSNGTSRAQQSCLRCLLGLEMTLNHTGLESALGFRGWDNRTLPCC